MPLTCFVVMAVNMMVSCGLKDGGNMLLWNDGTTSNFSGCHKLEDHKHTNNLGARWSVVIRLTPASHYLCWKWPQYWLDRKLAGFRIRCVRLTGWRPKILVRFPTEVKEFLLFKASLKKQYPEKKSVGRPRLQYLKRVARNTAADSYTAMKRMACNNCKWKAANQWEDWRIGRRKHTDQPCSPHSHECSEYRWFSFRD
jgi:RNase P subunit RPR2